MSSVNPVVRDITFEPTRSSLIPSPSHNEQDAYNDQFPENLLEAVSMFHSSTTTPRSVYSEESSTGSNHDNQPFEPLFQMRETSLINQLFV